MNYVFLNFLIQFFIFLLSRTYLASSLVLNDLPIFAVVELNSNSDRVKLNSSKALVEVTLQDIFLMT